MGDMSARGREVLERVHRVAAEDTRVAGQLLTLLGLKKPLISSHSHNEAQSADKIIECLAAGEDIALISDAGTPAVSDPGARVVKAAAAQGYPVVPVPGASSVLAIVAASGLVDGEFHFTGFLPSKGKAREQALQQALAHTCPVVLFEAPHRIHDLFKQLLAAQAGEQDCCVGREITKRFEHFYRGTVAQVNEQLLADSHGERGEFALVIAPSAAVQDNAASHLAGLQVDLDTLLGQLLTQVPTKTAVQWATQWTGLPKNTVYERALALKTAS